MSSAVEPEVIVIGGGVAGLSAATSLAGRGKRVLLLERRQHLGGRTYSFTDETTGDTVDNGQHVMMGCYTETLSYLNRVGSRPLTSLQPSLRIPFADIATGRSTVLKAGSLPAPLHIFSGLLGLSSLSLADKFMLARVGTELLRTNPTKESALDDVTVEQWLTALGQSERARRHLWDVIAIGTLNDHPGTVSALPFYRVLRAAFFGRRSNASLLIPHAGLSDILVHPARTYLEQRGSNILTGTAVDALMRSTTGITGLTLHSGETVTAPCVILAVPQYAAVDLLPDKETARPIGELDSSPIITINLWFDRQVMVEPFVALLNGRVQWAFNRTMLTGSSQPGQYLSCVISGARYHVEQEKRALISQAIEDLAAVFPAVAVANLTHTLVIKEVRATFTPRPGSEALRPKTETTFSNLFLAGDWTDTGIPATIEGAILSGHRAADAAFRYLER